MRSSLRFPADQAVFAGHFPAFPVVPGALLLDEALCAIHAARGIELQSWRLVVCKFMQAVRPGDTVWIEHRAARDDLIQFSITSSGNTVASGSLARIDAVPA